MSFFAELRRRNVIRMAGLYLVGAWVVVQVAETVLPAFDVPAWVLRAIIIVMALGFFPALIFAWVFELTPDGIKRDAEVDRTQSIAPKTGQRMNAMMAGLLALALAYFAIEKFVLAPTRGALDVAASLQSAKPKSRVAATPVISSKSIAVLPFENLSEEKANGFFADGIQDQILTGLAQIGDLKVISRTSTQKYASRPDNLSQIAKELGVVHILEGSVQRAGNRVRINVQLIQADSDSHLWAQTYDRTLDDIFAVESEVAQMIAESLAANLSGSERKDLIRKPTENAAAYAAYLRARAFNFGALQTRQQADRLLDAYRNAVELDPGFSMAWAQLARVLFMTHWVGQDPSGELRAEGERALARATELAPDSPQTAIARGVYMYYMQLDFSGALQIMNALKPKLPNDADLWTWAGFLSRRLGQWQESVADFEHAHALSPRDGYIAYHFAVSVIAAGDCQRGVHELDVALALAPDNTHTIAQKMQCAWADGDLPRAASYLQDADSRLPVVQGLHGVQLLLQRDYAAAVKELQRASVGNDDTLIDAFLAGYLAARIEYQLQLALAEQRSGNAVQAQVTYRQVKEEANKALADKPGNRYVETGWHCVLGLALAGLGEHEAAAAQGRLALSLVPESADRLEGPLWTWYVARIFALSGDAANAVPVLQHLLQTPVALVSAENLRNEPYWDAIRDDPGFQALLPSEGSRQENRD